MSDENDQVPQEVQDSPHFANLKRKLAAAEAERDTFKTQVGSLRGLLATNAVELAGFARNEDGTWKDPKVGLLMKEFTSSLADDAMPDKAAFAALAEQFGVKPEGTAPPAPTVQQQLQQLQQPGDTLLQLGQIPEPGDLDSQIAKAETDGNTRLALTLKNQKAAALMGLSV